MNGDGRCDLTAVYVPVLLCNSKCHLMTEPATATSTKVIKNRSMKNGQKVQVFSLHLPKKSFVTVHIKHAFIKDQNFAVTNNVIVLLLVCMFSSCSDLHTSRYVTHCCTAL